MITPIKFKYHMFYGIDTNSELLLLLRKEHTEYTCLLQKYIEFEPKLYYHMYRCHANTFVIRIV